VSINPFDDNGSLFVLVHDEEQHILRPTFRQVRPDGGHLSAKRSAQRVWTTSTRTGPTYGGAVYKKGRQRIRNLEI
jgi:uncharacterized protein YbdZ (MbtH family)